MDKKLIVWMFLWFFILINLSIYSIEKTAKVVGGGVIGSLGLVNKMLEFCVRRGLGWF